MGRLNPFEAKRKELIKKLEEERNKKRAATLKAKRKDKKGKSARTKKFAQLKEGLVQSFADAE